MIKPHVHALRYIDLADVLDLFRKWGEPETSIDSIVTTVKATYPDNPGMVLSKQSTFFELLLALQKGYLVQVCRAHMQSHLFIHIT